MPTIFYSTLYEPLPFLGEDVRIMRSGYLSRELISEGYNLHVWVPSFDHVSHSRKLARSGTELLPNGATINYLNGISYKSDRSIFRYLHNLKCGYEYSRSISKIKSAKPDLVVSQIPSVELAYQAMLFAKKNQLPFIVDVRDPYPDNYKRLFSKKLQFLYPYLFNHDLRKVREILNYAIGITAVSDSYLKWALDIRCRKIPEPYSKTFHIGYEFSKNVSEPNSDFQRNLDIFVKHSTLNLVFAGTFESNIDLKLILDLAALIDQASNRSIKILVAGKGRGEELLRNCQYDCLLYLDWLDTGDLRYLYEKSNVALIPYSADALQSLPNKPFECMAHGLPLINQLKGELAEMISISHIGFNISQGDSHSLYNLLLNYINNPQLLSVHSNNSLSLFEQKFTTQSIYPRFVQFIEKVVFDGRS